MTRRSIGAIVAVALLWSPLVRAQSPYPYPPPPGAPPPPAGTPWGAPAAPSGEGAWGAPGAPVPLPPIYGPRWVHVQMSSDDSRTRIDRVIPGGGTVPVCFAPCNQMLDSGSMYVIQGDGVRSTSRFMLPDDRDSVRLTVQAGSTARVGGGAVLMGAGFLAAYVGLFVWAAGVTSNSIDNSFGDMPRNDHTVAVGETMVVAGLAGGVLGLYLLASTHTSVTSSTGSTFTRDTSGPRRWPRIALTPRGFAF